MTIFACKRSICGLLILGAAAVLLASSATARGASAQDPSRSSQADPQKEKIHIVADELISRSDARSAEFVGNVRATQGNTVITSDRLKIFYAEGLAASGNPSAGEGAIKSIVATGNVKISFDNRVAVAQQAVYDTESRVLVLSGPQSKITSGADSISGEKITYNRSDGRITVESGRESRVEAVFQSGSGGIP